MLDGALHRAAILPVELHIMALLVHVCAVGSQNISLISLYVMHQAAGLWTACGCMGGHLPWRWATFASSYTLAAAALVTLAAAFSAAMAVAAIVVSLSWAYSLTMPIAVWDLAHLHAALDE